MRLNLLSALVALLLTVAVHHLLSKTLVFSENHPFLSLLALVVVAMLELFVR